MAVDYEKLGQRIQNARNKKKLSQEGLARQLNHSRELISFIERAQRTPTIDTLVEIANALGVSADDLLVDSLTYSSSTADTELHKLLLNCNQREEEVLIELTKYMKAVLFKLGI